MCASSRQTGFEQRQAGGSIGFAPGVALVLGGAAAAWLQQRRMQAQQRMADDVADMRVRTESIERLLRTVE